MNYYAYAPCFLFYSYVGERMGTGIEDWERMVLFIELLVARLYE